MDFHGVKVAVLVEGKLLMHLRDDKSGLFNANMWDFPGGGREGDETPEECAVREVKEEFGITLPPDSFIWKRDFPAQKDPTLRAFFLVAHLPKETLENVILGEGQRWDLIDTESFFSRSDVVPALKVRFQNYLNSMQSRD